MHVVNVNASDTSTKPYASETNSKNTTNKNVSFHTIYEGDISKDPSLTKVIEKDKPEEELVSTIPSWVEKSYGYDPTNPRKPNMLELMQALSNKSHEELHSDTNPETNWRKYAFQTSEILYGVVRNTLDTRDWNKIMTANDVLSTARAETGELLKPRIEISSETNIEGEIISQYAILKDRSGRDLRPLTGSKEYVEETLKNYGATTNTIPDDFESKVDLSLFNSEVLKVIKKYNPDNLKSDKKVSSQSEMLTFDKIAQKATTEVIAKQVDNYHRKKGDLLFEI